MADVALICGAAGFLGSHAAAAFRGSGWEVVGAGRGDALGLAQYPKEVPFRRGDFESPVFVSQLLEETRPSRLIFVAGPSDVQRSVIDPVRDFRDQMLPLIQVLWAVSQIPNPPGVLLVSSAAVYGNAAVSPVSENVSPSPISPYGFHKLGQEALLDEFGKLYGVPVCKARVFSTFGPGLRRLAVWDITRRALAGDYELRGTGKETRDYLHVADLARALECIASRAPFQGEAINVASGQESSMGQVASLIYGALGVSALPRFDDKCLAGSPLRWHADVSTLLGFGFKQQMSLGAGIKETVDWIRSNA
jgi:UDP-glucose 4-epimerase